METCNKPPAPWYCSRELGHDGPCATRFDDRAMLNVTMDPDGIDVAVSEPDDTAIIGLNIIAFGVIAGGIGGFFTLLHVGFWSSILGFVFSVIIGAPIGFIIGRLEVKRRRKHAVSQVRAPDAPGVQQEVPVPKDGESTSGMAV